MLTGASSRSPLPGLLCDLLWSDPDKDISGWGENDRGVSFTFGADVVTKFLQKHDMDLICRAHQVVEDGYEFFAKRQLVTLFSAPNYCTLRLEAWKESEGIGRNWKELEAIGRNWKEGRRAHPPRAPAPAAALALAPAPRPSPRPLPSAPRPGLLD